MAWVVQSKNPHSPYQFITLDPEPGMTAAPPVTALVREVDFKFRVPAVIPAGLTTLGVYNAGPSIHELDLAKLHPGKTLQDLLAYVKQQNPSGPPPADSMGSASSMSPGQTQYTVQQLTPGSYVLLCFVPDFMSYSGQGHGAAARHARHDPGLHRAVGRARDASAGGIVPACRPATGAPLRDNASGDTETSWGLASSSAGSADELTDPHRPTLAPPFPPNKSDARPAILTLLGWMWCGVAPPARDALKTSTSFDAYLFGTVTRERPVVTSARCYVRRCSMRARCR